MEKEAWQGVMIDIIRCLIVYDVTHSMTNESKNAMHTIRSSSGSLAHELVEELRRMEKHTFHTFARGHDLHCFSANYHVLRIIGVSSG